jgi:hypothetical protein
MRTQVQLNCSRSLSNYLANRKFFEVYKEQCIKLLLDLGLREIRLSGFKM